MDTSDVGHGKTHPEPVCKHDAEQGYYKDSITPVATEDRLPTAQMPKAPDPSPFVLGPTGG